MNVVEPPSSRTTDGPAMTVTRASSRSITSAARTTKSAAQRHRCGERAREGLVSVSWVGMASSGSRG
jgi:hypothetical protein